MRGTQLLSIVFSLIMFTGIIGGSTAFGVDETTNAESEKILKEAAAVAESSTNQMFPSVPTDTQEASTAKFL